VDNIRLCALPKIARNRSEEIVVKHAVIVGHPRQDSFTMSVAQAYAAAAEGLGHDVVSRDLYRLAFDPCLKDGEIPRPAGFSAAEDVRIERGLIADADVFVLIYPLWFYLPPAVVVGYVQRIFGMGFGYGPVHAGGNQPLLAGRRLISFTSSGAPSDWVASEGAGAALSLLLDKHLAGVCGLTVLDHLHFGSVLNSSPAKQIEAHLADVSTAVRRLFVHTEE
jgi:NAD(P)H dehydrogenase (quinone)